jgi:hypothetical protein
MNYKDLENGLNAASRLMLYTTTMDKQQQPRQIADSFQYFYTQLFSQAH